MSASKLASLVVNSLAGLQQTLLDDWLCGWNPGHIGDLRGMNALVTGGNSGIGWEVCRKLAENGAKVYMVSRDVSKGKDAINKICEEVPKAQLELLQCDLANMKNVLQLIEDVKASGDYIHILINNAVVFFPGPFTMTEDNIEQTMAVNHYSHALLTLGLLDRLAPGARLVFMSSEGEGALSMYDLQNMRGDKFCDGSGSTAYGTSKLYMIMFARELATRLKGQGKHVDVFAVQPGLVNTPGHDKMDRSHYLNAWFVSGMGKLFGQNQYHGAWSTLYAATDPKLIRRGFAYIGPNMLGMWHATERQPGNTAGRNPISCWAVFQGTVQVLKEVTKDRMPLVPHHPNDVVALKAS